MTGLYSSLVIFFLLQAHQSSAVPNITAAEPLLQNQTLVSGQIFELAFFIPNESANQYMGIWYKSMTPSKIVWVANRDTPLAHSDQSAKLTIGSDGNLRLVDEQQNIVWPTNASVHSNNTMAMLSDGGNFALQDRNSVEIWASFDDSTDTLLPNMKIGLNNGTGGRQYLVSRKNDNNPSSIYFVTGIMWETPPQLFTWNGSSPYWRSGPWDKSTCIGIPEMDSSYFSVYILQQDPQQGTTYFSADTMNNSLLGYGFISPGGILALITWDYGSKSWLTNWEAPSNSCEVYGTCSPFGICNSLKSPICRCVKVFMPRSKEEWNRRSASKQVKKEVFMQMNRMKVPDSAEYLLWR